MENSATAAAAALSPAAAPPHRWTDDLQALLTGTVVVALAVLLLRQGGLVTGGTAGAALVLHYATGGPFGAWFFVLNLPFYALAWRRMGARFTLKTLAAVALLAGLSELLPQVIAVQWVDTVFAALAGGALAGVGLLILFRHHASLGGLNILVLWLQERRGWRAGHTQAVIDVAILCAAAPWLSLRQLALSVLGALTLNLVLATNHRPGRYAAM